MRKVMAGWGARKIVEPLEPEFEQLFHEHYSLIYRTAYSVTGSREDADDVAQTIFLRLYRRGDWSSLRENPRAYLYRSAVNAAISVMRSKRRHIFTDNDSELGRPVESTEAKEEQPAKQRQQFLQALAQLSPQAVEI